jgi:hypothetical protein
LFDVPGLGFGFLASVLLSEQQKWHHVFNKTLLHKGIMLSWVLHGYTSIKRDTNVHVSDINQDVTLFTTI